MHYGENVRSLYMLERVRAMSDSNKNRTWRSCRGVSLDCRCICLWAVANVPQAGYQIVMSVRQVPRQFRSEAAVLHLLA
eukprot:COSAG02_NODE_62203_length_266_cov_0.928144_1_plen_78_part_01